MATSKGSDGGRREAKLWTQAFAEPPWRYISRLHVLSESIITISFSLHSATPRTRFPLLSSLLISLAPAACSNTTPSQLSLPIQQTSLILAPLLSNPPNQATKSIKMRYSLAAIAALTASVSAHGVITEVQGANGVNMPGLSGTISSQVLLYFSLFLTTYSC